MANKCTSGAAKVALVFEFIQIRRPSMSFPIGLGDKFTADLRFELIYVSHFCSFWLARAACSCEVGERERRLTAVTCRFHSRLARIGSQIPGPRPRFNRNPYKSHYSWVLLNTSKERKETNLSKSGIK